MSTLLDDVGFVVSSGATMAMVAGGLLYIHPHGSKWRKTLKEWRTTGVRAKKMALAQARAHKKRMAVYNVAAEARRKAIETKMLNRQDARKRWETDWVEAGAHLAMLDPTFAPAPEGAPKQIDGYGDDSQMTMVIGSRLGTWNDEEEHRYLVGNQAERHLGYYCDICKPVVEKNMAEAEAKKKAVAEAKAIAAQQIQEMALTDAGITSGYLHVQSAKDTYISAPDGRAMHESFSSISAKHKPDPQLVDSMVMATLRDELMSWLRQFKNKAPGPVETKAAAGLIALLHNRQEPAPIWVEVIAAGRNPRAMYKMLDKQSDTETGLTKAEEKLYNDLDNEMWDFND